MIDGYDRRPAELRGGNRQHTRTATEINAAAARVKRQEQFETEARRRVCTGTKCLTGVDDEIDLPAIAVGGLPRRPNAKDSPPILERDRLVKSLPLLIPIVGNNARRDFHQRATGGGFEVRQGRQLARGAIDRVLDRAVLEFALFDSGRRKLD
ncbi:unannotated protein [freshwater metagenome]|uniref:Unannotated protein n=1 Tax=freshwater metagenome TaxID=449393 RepID=A0A6J6A1C2_9ZZZZ